MPARAKRAHDPVKAPRHYVKGRVEPIHLIESMQLGAHEANVVKYVCRWRDKNGLEDLRKARWFLNRLIRLEQRRRGG